MAEEQEDQLSLDSLLSTFEDANKEAEAPVEAPAEEAPAEEAPAEEAPVEAAPAEEAPAEEAPVEPTVVTPTTEAMEVAADVSLSAVSPEDIALQTAVQRVRAAAEARQAAYQASLPEPTLEEAAAEIEDSTDPNGWLEQISDWAGSESEATTTAYAKQYVDIYASTISALPTVANNVIEAVDAMGEALHGALPAGLQKTIASGELDYLPMVGLITSGIRLAAEEDPLVLETYDSATVLGEISGDIAQIAVTFIPAVKAVKWGTAGITGGLKFTGKLAYGVGAAETTVATGLSEFFAWELADKNIATTLTNGNNEWAYVEVFGTDVTGPALEMLSIDPDDGVLMARTKQALEGILLGGAAGVVLEGLKPLYKLSKTYVQSLELWKKGVDDAGWSIDHTPGTTTTTVVDGVETTTKTNGAIDAMDSVVPATADSPATRASTKPVTREERTAAREAAVEANPDAPGAAPLIPADPADAGVAYLKELNPDVDVSVQMGGRTNAPALADDAVEAMATGARDLDEVLRGLNYGGLNTAAAVRRLFTQAADAVMLEKGLHVRGKVDVLDDVTLEVEARRLGVTEEELLERQFKATAETAEFNEAAQRIVAAAEARLREVAEAYKRSGSPLVAMAMSKQLRMAQILKAQRDTLATEAARSVRISSGDTATFDNPELMRLLNEVDPGKEVWTTKQINAAVEELSSELPLGGPVSDEAIAAQVHLRNQGSAEDAAALADIILNTKSDAMAKALRDVPAGFFANWGELLNSYQFFSMLSKIPTHVTNGASLVGSITANVAERYTAELVARSYEKLGGKVGASRIAPGEGRALAAGTIEGIKVAYREAVDTAKLNLFNSVDEAGNLVEARGFDWVDPNQGRTVRTQLEGLSGTTNRLGTRRYTGAQRSMGKIQAIFYDNIGAVLNSTSVGLHTMDTFFRAIARVQETAALAQRVVDSSGLTGEAADILRRSVMDAPPASIQRQAQRFAKETAFVEDATGGVKFLNDAARDASGNAGVVWRIGASATIPFMRTTMNLAKWSGRRSPLGFFMDSVKADLKAGGAQATLAHTRMVMGSATGVGALGLAANGLLTNKGPSDPSERATWLLTHDPESILIAGEWIPLAKLEPYGTILRAWGAAGELMAIDDSETTADAVGAVLLTTTMAMFDATVGPALNSLLDLADPRHDGKNAADLIADVIAKQLAPGFVQTAFEVTGNSDDIWRDTDGILEEVRAQIPWLSNDDLPPHRNIWGQPIARTTLGPDGISPLTTGSKDPREIDDWLWEQGVGLTLPGRTVSFSGNDAIELTTREYSRYVELAGNGVKLGTPALGMYDFLNAAISGDGGASSDAWNRLTDTAADGTPGSREAWIIKVIGVYREAARAELARTSPDINVRREEAFQSKVNAFDPEINKSTGGSTDPVVGNFTTRIGS